MLRAIPSLFVGMTVGALLFAAVGMITARAGLGAICGAVVGAVAGLGMHLGIVSSAVVWICCFAVAGAFLGPAVDADSLLSALAFGAVGGWIGYTGLRGALALVGAIVGLNLGAASGEAALGLVGLCAGGALGWTVAGSCSGKNSEPNARGAE